MSPTDTAIRQHMRAAADLLQHALADAQRDDPEGVDGLRLALKAGAMVRIESTFSVAGTAHLAVRVISPTGDDIGTLVSCELQRQGLTS